MDDRIAAYLELEQDPVFPHLSPAERRLYVEWSLAVGREQGLRYHGRDVFDLAQELGARIERTGAPGAWPPGAPGITIRASYGAGVITLYEHSLAGMAEALGAPWAPDRVAAMHAAHELFHHLEETRLGMVHEALPPVTVLRLGPVTLLKRRVRRTRETAADAFAKALLDLPVLPNVLDWQVMSVSSDTLTAAVARAQAAL